MSTYPNLKQRRSLPITLPADSDELKATREILKEAKALIKTLLGSAKPETLQCENVSDVFKLSQSLAGLAKVEIEMSRLLVDRTHIINEAKKSIMLEVQKSVSFDVRLQDELAHYVEQHAEAMAEGPHELELEA